MDSQSFVEQLKTTKEYFAAILEHTAHHRGVLTVHSRLCGHTPAMPYMDM